ncbi:MAG: hypothetical protein PHW65_03215 [Dehalococcoidales bacterium]|nr:hypothetical protein [Dehalococcoidales bacterium]
MTPDPLKESRKRIRRVAALGIDEPIIFRRKPLDPYNYQISRVAEYAWPY